MRCAGCSVPPRDDLRACVVGGREIRPRRRGVVLLRAQFCDPRAHVRCLCRRHCHPLPLPHSATVKLTAEGNIGKVCGEARRLCHLSLSNAALPHAPAVMGVLLLKSSHSPPMGYACEQPAIRLPLATATSSGHSRLRRRRMWGRQCHKGCPAVWQDPTVRACCTDVHTMAYHFGRWHSWLPRLAGWRLLRLTGWQLSSKCWCEQISKWQHAETVRLPSGHLSQATYPLGTVPLGLGVSPSARGGCRYGYYFMATLGFKSTTVKKAVTLSQMVQFCAFIAQVPPPRPRGLPLLQTECETSAARRCITLRT